MSRHTLCKLLAFLIVMTCAPAAYGQVTAGIRPFNSYGGGPFDKVNLSNLNVHFDIPVFSRAGRAGMNFTYALGFDSSDWYPSSGVWTPVVGWGWRGETEAETGYVSATTGNFKCFPGSPYPPGYWYMVTTYSGWVYHDRLGASHSFSGIPTLMSCPGKPQSGTATTNDGSGYQIAAYPGYATITSKTGSVYDPPFQSGAGYGSATDTNGNEITFDGTTFTDTLGTSALTIAGTNPLYFKYTAPSGATASYTVNYSTYTVRTNFGCSGIGEFGPTLEALVSSIVLPDGTSYTITYEQTPGYSGDYTGRIASITLPAGGQISYSYTGGSNGIRCTDGAAAGLTRVTPDGTWMYTRSGTDPNRQTIVQDPAGNQTVIQFQTLYETERQIYQGTQSSGTLLDTINTCYNGHNTLPCTSTSVSTPISRRTIFPQWPGGQESERDEYYNSYGLQTEVDEYAYGSGSPGSVVRKILTTYASLSNDIENRPATVTICTGSGSDSSCNSTGTRVAQTTYTYDQGSVTATSNTPQHVSISGSRGNPTTVAYLVQGSTTLSRTFSYYDTGNVYVATDVNGAQTTLTYGACGNSFVTSVSLPLSLPSVSQTWNCTGGVVTSTTDPNSQTTSTSYTDPYFWRPASTTDQANYTTTLTYSTGPITAEATLNFNGTSSTVDSLATLDSLGRPLVRQSRQSPSATNFDSVETDYDSLGRPSRVTVPYSGTAGLTNSSAPATTTTYDAMNRPALVTDGGSGTVTYFYGSVGTQNNDVLIKLGPAPSGENLKQKQMEYDALGRLTSVCELTSGTGGGTCGQNTTRTGFWTTYTYDLLGDLTGVTQNAQASSSSQETRSYYYDDLGRTTSETNPETGPSSSSGGTTTYVYDTDPASTCATSYGDLVKKTDPVGNVTCYTYDALHRVTSAIVVSGSYASVTPKKYFVYDSATVNSVTMTHVAGRLAEAYTCISTCTSKITDIGLSYSVRGEITDLYESTPHSSGYYHTTLSYWANGLTDVLTGPGIPNITYAPDGEGRISTVSASSGQNPVTGMNYNLYASTPQTTVTFGSGDSDVFNYDLNTYRVTQYKFNVGSQSVTGALRWNANGTLSQLAITDQFNASNTQTCKYGDPSAIPPVAGYDDLARLVSANCGSVWAQTFSYDPFGNLSKSGSQSFSPVYAYSGDPNKNQYIPYTGFTAAYDNNGNVTADPNNAYSWDANGRPITVDGVNLTYDALGRMVEQNSGSVYDEIAYTPTGAKLALMSGSTLVKAFISLPAGAQAVYTSSGLAYYRHGDWLGSSRFASTPSQTLYSDTAYAPFGEHYATAGTTDLSFTGQNQDTASGVYDFPARELGEVSGRWPSPDPAGLASVNPGDPQTWNRYAYVRNSPLNFTDPTGLGECEGACLDGGGGGGGYCSPEYAYCGDPCTDFGVYCIGGDYGGDDGGAGSPGLPPAAPPSFPLDTTNALNEVDGLPAGMQLPQLSAWCLVSPSCSGPSPTIENLLDASAGAGATDQGTLGKYLITLRILSMEFLDDGGCTDGSFLCNGLRQDPGALRSLHMAGNMLNSGKFYAGWFGASALAGVGMSGSGPALWEAGSQASTNVLANLATWQTATPEAFGDAFDIFQNALNPGTITGTGSGAAMGLSLNKLYEMWNDPNR